MTKDQEARILGNQAAIMKALAALISQTPVAGAAVALRERAADNETFIRDYLK